MLSRERRCSWSSADRQCSSYIWVINLAVHYPYKSSSNIRFTSRKVLVQFDESYQGTWTFQTQRGSLAAKLCIARCKKKTESKKTKSSLQYHGNWYNKLRKSRPNIQLRQMTLLRNITNQKLNNYFKCSSMRPVVYSTSYTNHGHSYALKILMNFNDINEILWFDLVTQERVIYFVLQYTSPLVEVYRILIHVRVCVNT